MYEHKSIWSTIQNIHNQSQRVDIGRDLVNFGFSYMYIYTALHLLKLTL